VAVGLHLDLTHRPFDGRRPPFGLTELIGASLSGRTDVGAIEAEFERQLERFESALGHGPDHVDGHHHVHALPRIRTALCTVLLRRWASRHSSSRPLVRNPGDSPARIARRRGARAKALIVAGLSAGFGARAEAAGFATNIGFAGYSRFSGENLYAREFAGFLSAPGLRHLVMCHPGLADGSAGDPIAAARVEEYQYLRANDGLSRELLTIRRGRDEEAGAFATWRGGESRVRQR
jgi:predicted glycoside hydrolase/deacetylase ChbG (UPF0249 family)